MTGLEPAIFGSEVRRLIHKATWSRAEPKSRFAHIIAMFPKLAHICGAFSFVWTIILQ